LARKQERGTKTASACPIRRGLLPRSAVEVDHGNNMSAMADRCGFPATKPYHRVRVVDQFEFIQAALFNFAATRLDMTQNGRPEFLRFFRR
jgi:hypothetical protein